MWIYRQTTGELLHNNLVVAVGYSGHSIGKNNPIYQNVHNVGPIPCGFYTFGEPHDSQGHGPFCIPLIPDVSNEMFGRSGFLMHGDSLREPGTASQGCIVMARPVRHNANDSGDKRLQVVEE